MNFRTFKAYVVVILSGLVILAAVLLIVLQWGNAAEFSAYGKNIDIDKTEGRTTGGVNTALLMLFSMIGGLLLFVLCRWFIGGLRNLRQSQHLAEIQRTQQQTAQRLSQLESAGREDRQP